MLNRLSPLVKGHLSPPIESSFVTQALTKAKVFFFFPWSPGCNGRVLKEKIACASFYSLKQNRTLFSTFNTFSFTSATSSNTQPAGFSQAGLVLPLHLCTWIPYASTTPPYFNSPAMFFHSSFDNQPKGQHLWGILLYLSRKIRHDKTLGLLIIIII